MLDWQEKIIREHHIIPITGEITENTYHFVCDAHVILSNMNVAKATIEITSNGGASIPMLKIFDLISTSEIKFTGIVRSIAASAGFIILQACEERYAYEGATLLTHNFRGGTLEYNPKKDFEKVIDKQLEQEHTLFKLLSRRTTLSSAQFKWLNERDTFLNAELALEMGLIDKILKISLRDGIATHPDKKMCIKDYGFGDICDIADDLYMRWVNGNPNVEIHIQFDAVDYDSGMMLINHVLTHPGTIFTFATQELYGIAAILHMIGALSIVSPNASISIDPVQVEVNYEECSNKKLRAFKKRILEQRHDLLVRVVRSRLKKDVRFDKVFDVDFISAIDAKKLGLVDSVTVPDHLK